MAIGLDNKVARSDVEKLKSTRNPPEFEEGFENESSGGDFSSLFDDFDFSSGGGNGSGSDNGDSDGGGMSASSIFGGSTGGSGFGTMTGGGAMSNGFGGLNLGQQQPQKSEPSIYDKAFEGAMDSLTALGRVLLQAFNSLKLRTADDWGYFSACSLKAALVMGAIGLVVALVGLVSDIAVLKFLKLPIQLILSSLLTLGTGMVGIGLAAVYIEMYGGGQSNDINQIENIPQETNETYNDDIYSELSALFGGDDDEEEEYEPEESSNNNEDDIDDIFNALKNDTSTSNTETVDFESQIDNIQSNVPIITRQLLFDTFIKFFPLNEKDFDKETEIEPETEMFYQLETIAIKALASAGKMEYEDATERTNLNRAIETAYTYVLWMKRLRSLSKLDDIEREMVAYFREDSSDDSVSCTVDLEGDFYKIVLTKGESLMVTMGDILATKAAKDYVLDERRMLPFIAGINSVGKPIMADGKIFDTMLIAGKPRSGKSWYLLSILWMFMVFNTPEDVQLLIIDPKQSNLFNTMALMPHVCGLHDDSNILNIMRDLVENEGPRRKKLLADNKCENIWDLREKGIKIPVLYLVIDEVMTVLANLSGNEKEFESLVKVIVTQLPSQGIRLIMIPHRSKGVINPTIRTNISFTAAIRADTDIVCETLGISKWKIPLVNAGDTALKMQGHKEETFVRGPAVTSSDSSNTEHMMAVARAFYKMGVEIPDMKGIGCGYNRNMDYIKEQLKLASSSNKVQFDLNDVDDIDLDALNQEQEENLE